MSLTDPVANLLCSIKNAAMVQKDSLDVPASKATEKILQIFKETGYIEDYKGMKDSVQGSFKIYLKYENQKSAISNIKRISRPGLRVYKGKGELPRVLNGMGTAVISTSKGIISDKEARKQNVGGEVVCYIW